MHKPIRIASLLMSLVGVNLLFACKWSSPTVPATMAPGSPEAAIAICGAGLDRGAAAQIEAEYSKLGGRIGAGFYEYVRTIIFSKADSGDRQKIYDKYIECVLEIDKRNRLPATSLCPAEGLQSQLLRASASDRRAIVTITSQDLRERFRRQEFDCVSRIADTILALDQNNGHGLYYAGEVWRVKGAANSKQADLARSRMREHFFRYLDFERSLALTDRDGNASACYTRETGYCAERTAWINHLLAVDYYSQAEKETDPRIKANHLRRAASFVKADLDFGGFDQIIPSRALDAKIREEQQKLGNQ